MKELEEASLTWLQKQQKKLEERKAAQRRREGLHGEPCGLMRELKTSLDRARSETTDGYAASESASLFLSEDNTSSTRESSPHKSRLVPIQIENNGFEPVSASTPKSSHNNISLSRHVSDISYDRSKPLIQRRLRYDSDGEQSGLVNSTAVSNASLDSISSRPTTPGFPTTPVFGLHSGYGNSRKMICSILFENSILICSANSLKRLPQSNNGTLRAPSPSTGSMYHQSSRRGSFSSEPADVAPSNVRLAKANSGFWYKPHISREDAIKLLRPRPPGTFVVRDSNSFPGAFGLALKVATPPLNAPPTSSDGDELIRHFLIEPTSKGVKLKGYSNEPVFASLSALVYQHTVTPLALPSRLILPEADLAEASPPRNPADSKSSSMQQLLSLGAACNVLYLFSMETDSLTGE